MARQIITVNFDNNKELFDYISSKENRSEFIRYCIRKEMMEEAKTIDGSEFESKIEKIVMKCLKEYQPKLEVQSESDQSDEFKAAVDFFDED